MMKYGGHTMNNFTFHNPVAIHFGKGSIEKLNTILKEYGNNVLLVYGGGSIKKNGLYDAVYAQLDGFNVVELAGVNPNPRIESVREGVKLCREHNVDVILAVGGGSTIDCSKAIAGATFYEKDAWDIVKKASLISKALPIVDVLTIAATGSEMNNSGVITNFETNEKLGFANPLLYPKASILDPQWTYSVPKYHTAAGVADIMSHTFEQYFNATEGGYFPRELCHSVLKTCIKYGPVALHDPTNYEARSNIMWAATIGLNGLIGCGIGKSWSCHPMEHALSAYFDVTHGIGLAVLTPSWMRYILNEDTVVRFVEYGVNVWGIDPLKDKFEIAKEAIDKTAEFFFTTLEIPSTLHEIGIDAKFDEMAQEAVDSKGGKINGYKPLLKEDVLQIFDMCK